MPAFLITYDLTNKKPDDYQNLIDTIKTYGTWARVTESTWIVLSEEKASDIRDNLKQHMKQDDRLFVLKSGVAAAWSNVRCRDEWLKKNL
ncbi:MAG: hypothetical protein JNL11_09660 [Bdellovibrionaceae bacterium]|nr:hypothetical protein [Pseudobdellovibrionaceae bacterium]